jgi:pSer/pThr/pTyr-binding forkhead associated (FHA) protein
MNSAVDRRDLTYKALAGLVGGAVGWVPVELASRGHSLTQALTTTEMTLEFASMAILSGMIGGLILAVDEKTFALTSRVKHNFVRGLIACAVLALPANYFSNLAFSSILEAGGWGVNHPGSVAFLFVGRVISWALMGLMLGAGVGIASLSLRNIVKGALGGWIGGFVGGLLFDPLSYLTGGGLLSRLVGTCVTGLAIGLFIGLVQELTKNAWLVVEAGRLKGRQFRLERDTMTVGRAEENAVGLFGDPAVQPRHAVISRAGQSWQIRSLAVAAGTRINGRVVETVELHDNDTIELGGYVLRFHLRGGAPTSRAAEASRPAGIATPAHGGDSREGPSLIDANGIRHRLKDGVPTTLGRAVDNDIVISDPSVSRHHARLVIVDGAAELRDLGSQNGTFVGDRRITATRLAEGDTIRLGDARFTFRG